MPTYLVLGSKIGWSGDHLLICIPNLLKSSQKCLTHLVITFLKITLGNSGVILCSSKEVLALELEMLRLDVSQDFLFSKSQYMNHFDYEFDPDHTSIVPVMLTVWPAMVPSKCMLIFISECEILAELAPPRLTETPFSR